MSAFQTRVFVAGLVAALAMLGGCGGGGGNDSSAGNIVAKTVTLSGSEENPSVTTQAAGTGAFTFNLDTGAVSGAVSTFGLTGVVAHIHTGASGVNGPIIIPLTQGPAGTWTVPAGATLTEAQIASLKAGELYVNVHSAANPGGEIRAQIGRQVFFATMQGAQEVPAVTTTASGTGRFLFDPDTRTLSGSVTTADINGTVAHVHTGVVGVSGPITIPMTGGPTWTLPPTVLTEAQAADLLAGRMYANVHTAANPGGEIRGQLYKPVRMANLSGASEVPPVTTTATGTCWVSVNPFTRAVAGRIESTLTGSIAAHVHRGSTTVAGPVVIPMTSPSPGTWVIPNGVTITDELLARFMEGNLYCNVHTPANPGGEIRGTLLTVQ
jgi:hypothetical protein